MPFLSPAKLLVILVIALVVLGPDKLPKVAKQIGGLWGDFRKFRQKLESEVRGSFPDLPSTETITHAVRSPLSLLDRLAEPEPPENGATPGVRTGPGPQGVEGETLRSSGTNRPAGTVQAYEVSSAVPRGLTPDPGHGGHQIRVPGGNSDDPGMN